VKWGGGKKGLVWNFDIKVTLNLGNSPHIHQWNRGTPLTAWEVPVHRKKQLTSCLLEETSVDISNKISFYFIYYRQNCNTRKHLNLSSYLSNSTGECSPTVL